MAEASLEVYFEAEVAVDALVNAVGLRGAAASAVEPLDVGFVAEGGGRWSTVGVVPCPAPAVDEPHSREKCSGAGSIGTRQMLDETELWRECVQWMVRLGALDKAHRVTWPNADLFDFAQALRDGVLLCHVANRLSKGSVDLREVSLRPQLSQFLCLKNICLFLNACQNVFCIEQSELFEAWELYKVADFGKVLNTLAKLSKCPAAAHLGIAGFPDANFSTTVEHEYYNDEIYRELAEVADSKELTEEVYDQVGDEDRDKIYDHLVTKAPLRKEEFEFSPTNQREHCIKELIDTECKYVDGLNLFIQQFYTPLKEVLGTEDQNTVFMNLPLLVHIHTSFKKELWKAVRQSVGLISTPLTPAVTPGPVEAAATQRIGDVFVKYKSHFVVYGDYCSQLTKAQRRIDQLCAENNIVKQKISACEIEANGNKFRLQDVLVVPFQRVLKYHLILKELVKLTPVDDESRHSLQLGWDAMRDLSLYLNEVTRDCEARQIVRDIQSSIIDLRMPDNTELCDYGRLHKDGELRIISHYDRDKKLKVRYIFLFDKVLLICKPGKNNQYSFKDALILREYRVEDANETNGNTRQTIKLAPKWNYSWCLVHRNLETVYVMYTKSAEVKESWLLAIKTAHENVSPPAAAEVDHSFEYASFDHAIECAQCKKLLRGIFFQGYRCTQCKISVHKECISVCRGCGRKGSLFRNNTFRESSQICIAVRSFSGNNGGPSFLSFKENDVVEVLSINTGLEGWWRGRIVEGECPGRTGLFPPDYVRRHNFSSSASKRPTWPCIRSSSALSHASGLSLNDRESLDEKSINTLHRKVQSRPTSLTTLGYLNLEDLPLYPWYVGEMDRIKAEQVLKGLPVGTFLIRFSPSQSRYAISISYSMEKIEVKHIKVERNERGFYLDVGQFFPSLVQLVNFYEENSLSHSFQSLDTTLKVPVKSLIVGYAIALHNFEATASNMISIHRGDGIIILSKKDSERGWWKGKVDEKVGYFPCSYVAEKDDLFADT